MEIPERSGTTANAEAQEKCGETPESSNDILSTKNTPGFSSYQEAAVTSDKRGRKRKLQDGQVKVVVVGGSCLPLTDILPFSAQHQVLIRLQKLLENMCLAFGLRWCAAAMREHRWTEPGSLELTSWIRYIQRYAHTLPNGALASTDPSIVKMISNSVASIRHHAVHRVAKGTRVLLECLENAKAFAELQYSAAHDRQVDGGCPGDSPRLDTQGSADALLKAMVDDRSNATPSHIHLLEKSGSNRKTCGTIPSRSRSDGESGGQAVPQRHPTTKEKALGRVLSRQRQHLEGRQIPEIRRRCGVREGAAAHEDE